MITDMLPDHDLFSILYADSVIPTVNHIPFVIEATEEGVPKEYWLLRGTKFEDENGVEVIPEGYLTNEEFFKLKLMVGYIGEDGVEVPRTLPMERSEIFDLVVQMREQQT